MLKKVSLKDVAQRAGVSTALVSFVLNGKSDKYRVGEETTKRILKVAKEMNYKPNLAAKALRSNETHTIGVVVSDISNPFFSQIARYLQDEAEKRGYTVLFGNSDEDVTMLRRVTINIINKGVDGLIIVPCRGSHKFIKSLVGEDTPLVLLDRYFDDINCSYVALNSAKASYLATKYILSKGFKRTSAVGYNIDLSYMQERLRGYVEAMSEAGLEKEIDIIQLVEEQSRESAKVLIPQAIEQGRDSFLCVTNILSEDSLYAMKELKEDVVDKLAIVGYDGSPAFDFFRTSIPYIQQPLEEMAKRAIEIIVDHMTNRRESEVKQLLIDGIFINN